MDSGFTLRVPRNDDGWRLTHLSGRASGPLHLSRRVLFSGHLLYFEHFLSSPCWLALGSAAWKPSG
jgi:hypothetical protein